ncbi:AAA family ATPase [Nitrobacter sp.]|uniref:AAA family ATPase n=1 Tax=Nitrobacter sp. TaxID=29420 RepID=UPI00321F97B6
MRRISVSEQWRSIMDQPLIAKSLSEFETRKIRWLFPPFIPRGLITTVAGDGEAGKSSFIYDIFARVTTGQPMPQFGDVPQHRVPRGKIIVLSKEDDPGLMIKPRMEAAGADMKRVRIIGRQNGGEFDVIDRLDRMNELEATIASTGNVRALVIDPITDFGGDCNLNREESVRQFLISLAKLAGRYNIAVVNVLHLNKSSSKPVRQRILGSVALVNEPRAALVVAKDRNKGRRYGKI